MSRCLFGSFLLLTAAAPAAVTISGFTFASNTSPTTQAMNTTTTVVTAGGNYAGGSPTSGRSTNDSNFFTRGATSTTFDTNQNYVSFTVTPGAMFKLDLTTLAFNYGVQSAGSSASYTTTFRLRSSLDAFATSIPTSYVGAPASATSTATASTTSGGATLAATATFSGVSFSNITVPVEFRLYATPSVSSFDAITRFDNIVLSGDVIMVPEPSSLALLGGFGVIALLRRRRA